MLFDFVEKYLSRVLIRRAYMETTLRDVAELCLKLHAIRHRFKI